MNSSSPNIAVKANIWCDELQADVNEPPFLRSMIPGDLAIEFLGTIDTRLTRRHLTALQHLEYEQSRFFKHHGQHGVTFE